MKELTSKDIRMFSRLGSCGVFGRAMCDLAKEDDRLAMITADLCFYSGLDRFHTTYPDYFYNVGIAEQSLVGFAGGMAKEGFNAFASTYASFAVTRALDQVRVNMGYMQLPIRLIGLTSGFSVGILGPTHICIEDLAIMRSIPNILVLSPADGLETYKSIAAAATYDGPVYLRLSGPMMNPMVYKEDYDFEIGKAIRLREGTDIAIIATGMMVSQSLKAAAKLEENAISCEVLDMHTIKPLDVESIQSAVRGKRMLVTVEEHSVIGGLGGAVAEALSEEVTHVPHVKIGVLDEYAHAAGYDYFIDKYGLTAGKIADQIANKMKELVS